MSLRARLVLFLICVLVAGVCLRLAWWQYGRLTQRRAANAVALAARAEPPRALDDPSIVAAAAYAGRRVTVTGVYDHARELVLRGRGYREVPGVEVVTPLRVAGHDTAVLVNRGFVPSADAGTVNLSALDEPGRVTVQGIAFPIRETGDSGRPVPIGGRETWARLDLAGLRARLPYPVAPVVIWQSPDSALPGMPRRLEPPALDDGPHLSYTIQWVAFAVIFLGGGIVVALRKDSGLDSRTQDSGLKT